MTAVGFSLLSVLAGIIGVVVVVRYFRQARAARDERLEGRAERTLHQIYASHFADSGIPERRFTALWMQVAEILELPAGRLLPSDRFRGELSPPKGFEFNDPINDVLYIVSRECQKAGANPDTVGTLHDYIMAVGRGSGRS